MKTMTNTQPMALTPSGSDIAAFGGHAIAFATPETVSAQLAWGQVSVRTDRGKATGPHAWSPPTV